MNFRHQFRYARQIQVIVFYLHGHHHDAVADVIFLSIFDVVFRLFEQEFLIEKEKLTTGIQFFWQRLTVMQPQC